MVIVDLVAEPVPLVDTPVHARVGDQEIQVDSAHEILVNKLNTLLSRAEYRDLFDLRALLAAGQNLERGIRDAAEKDGGFSAATLAWVLRTMPLAALGRAAGASLDEISELVAFRDEFVENLAVLSAPRP